MDTCSVDGCTARASAQGLCRRHYERARRAGLFLAIRATCSVEDCGKIAVARGWCDRHYRLWKRNGMPAPQPTSPEQRFLKFVGSDLTKSECWPWLGWRDEKGYGRFRAGGHHVLAHRYSYELLVGPITEGLTIDHRCSNTSCVNPAHMEVVSLRENILRGNNMAARYARRTECCRGHPFE
jgi:hypothetical protein